MHTARCTFVKHSFWNRDRLERGSRKKVPGVMRGWPADVLSLTSLDE